MVRTYEKKRLKQYTDYGFKLAVESVRTKHLTVHGAAKVFKVPYETLRGYILKGHHKSSEYTGGRMPEISHKEEESICQALIFMAEAGFPVGRPALILLTQTYLDELGRTTRFKNNKPGVDWVSVFVP